MQKQNSRNKSQNLPRTILVLLFFIYGIFRLLFPNPVSAQTVNCYDHIGSEEFHSLRPYRASVCTTLIDDSSQLCGNSLIVNDEISVTKPMADFCDELGGNRVLCHYSIDRSFKYRVDATKANLPIAGNTELVSNRLTSDAQIEPAEQINDYLSWYLNGTIFRAEELHRIKEDKTTGLIDYSPMVDYAGPIRKILPLIIQNNARKNQVESAGSIRHDQTVACVYKMTILGVVIGGIPAPCPTTNGIPFWEKLWNDINPFSPKELILTDWLPTPNLPPEQEDYNNFQDYYKAYRKWRGDKCFSIKIPSIIPGIGGFDFMYCVDDWGRPNFWGNQFAWIPFSSTEDKLGNLIVRPPEVIGGDVSVTDVKAPDDIISELYFPHMEENKQLSELLSSSIIPYDLLGDDSLGKTVAVDENANCKILEVRSNPGDKLFGEISKWQEFSYTANFDCTYTYTEEPLPTPHPNCPTGICRSSCISSEIVAGMCATSVFCCRSLLPTPSPMPIREWSPPVCVKHATFASKVLVDTPVIDDTWTKLVAGNTSIFRRMFPKINASTFGIIKDFPASSEITHEAESSKNTGITSVTSNPAEIYFPHLGGISEYFLKGIQTLIRPKGYGEQIEFGGSSGSGSLFGKCDGKLFATLNPPTSTTDLAKNMVHNQIAPSLTQNLTGAYAEAEKQTGVPCEVLAAVHFMEASNDPNRDLQSGDSLNGRTLVESAIQAGNEIKGKVGGTIASWEDLRLALSRYNGGGNRNCRPNCPYTGPCPPPEAIDDPYATSWMDSKHINMYLIYCQDHTQCPLPYPNFARPGAMAVAAELYQYGIK